MCSYIYIYIWSVCVYVYMWVGANNFVVVSWLAKCWQIITDWAFKFIVINRSWPVRKGTRSCTSPPLATCFSLHGIIWHNPGRRWGEEQSTLRLWLLSCVLDWCRTPVYCREWGVGTVLGFQLHHVSVDEEDLAHIKQNDTWPESELWPQVSEHSCLMKQITDGPDYRRTA